MPHGRAIGRGTVEPELDLLQEHLEEVRVGGTLVGDPQIEHVVHEGLGELEVHALEETGQAGVVGEALHELLVVEDLVADLPELLGRQIQELATLEALGVDAVRQAGNFTGEARSSWTRRLA